MKSVPLSSQHTVEFTASLPFSQRSPIKGASKLLGEDFTCQGIECQGQLASMLRPLEGVSDF